MGYLRKTINDMKKKISILWMIAICASSLVAQEKTTNIALVIHGGAGTITKSSMKDICYVTKP